MGNGMKKVELLAPAGNFVALKGAINAGADAVYLGGEKYGARAYADNFSREEICEGIHLAHELGRKIYLTVNTLIKENELNGIYSFLKPYYECGLDGVIVQDIGALRFIKRHFPFLELHASTQMTITGSYGINILKNEGVSRIVPARELSLGEIKEIKRRTGIEIEAFIHGAMCYCYSGQCLFSSILGGRSGNRGRCAQPCRLPYRIGNGREQYPLSMRDMCTIKLIPQLIEAGIDSFKIEGRMKKPVYAAGVTAIYRKYIDLYYEDPEHYHVQEKDMEMLNALYIRSEIGDGYYHRHNGKEMISLDSPAYSPTDEKLMQLIEQEYLEKKPAVDANAEITLIAGKPAELKLNASGVETVCKGAVVQTARRQPLSGDKVVGQIQKSGNSNIRIKDVNVNMQGDVFMPIGDLNELRRNAVSSIERELIRENGLLYEERKKLLKAALPERKVENIMDSKSENHIAGDSKALKLMPHRGIQLHIFVSTLEQLQAALSFDAERIYLDYGLIIREGVKELQRLAKGRNKEKNGTALFYAATPYIVRNDGYGYLEEIQNALDIGFLSGVLIRNMESYGFFSERTDKDKLVLDTGMYLWNHESISFFEQKVAEFYLPVECNFREIRELLDACNGIDLSCSLVSYGRLPMMISANCLRKTEGICKKESGITILKDRYGKSFPVLNDCLSCYNVVYNSVPLSLHKQVRDKNRQLSCCRLDFTTENGKETEEVMRFFMRNSDCNEEPPYQEYTTGHYKRGVE